MKEIIFLVFIFCSALLNAQQASILNTARNSIYMKAEEREMIYEINQLRSNPKTYLKYIQPLLDKALKNLNSNGKGEKNYALRISTSTVKDVETKTVDTIWNYQNDEEVKALKSLVSDLKKIKSLPILLPDSGIYLAAKSFGADQELHRWKLIHQGSDGSWPWDRIRKFSPKMTSGNENGAGNSFGNSPRSFVIQLLIDSGIPGYGHRYNLLNKGWTHVACFSAGKKEGMYRWIQNFGASH